MWMVVEWSLLFLIGLTVITQVVVPSVTDWPFFWLFRRNDWKRLAEAKGLLDEAKVESRIRELEREIDQTRDPGPAPEEEKRDDNV